MKEKNAAYHLSNYYSNEVDLFLEHLISVKTKPSKKKFTN